MFSSGDKIEISKKHAKEMVAAIENLHKILLEVKKDPYGMALITQAIIDLGLEKGDDDE